MANIKFTTEQIKQAGAFYYQYQSYARTAEECARQWGDDKVSKQQIKYWDDNSDVFAEGKKVEAKATDKRLSKKMLDLETKALDRAIKLLDEDPDQLKFKEIAWAAAVMHDKRQVLEGKATNISGPSKDFQDRLTDIESKLAERSAKRSLGEVAMFPGKNESAA